MKKNRRESKQILNRVVTEACRWLEQVRKLFSPSMLFFLSSTHAKGILIRTRVGLKNEAFTMLLILFLLRFVYVCCMAGAAATSG